MVTAGQRRRRLANACNGSTALGRLLARTAADGAIPHRDGLLLACGYRPRLPLAAAFTVGNVVLVRADRTTVLRHDATDPRLIDHEARHATQYAWCLGLPFLLLYGACAGWSYVTHGDWWSGNAFERAAGLADGGYRENPRRCAAARARRAGAGAGLAG